MCTERTGEEQRFAVSAARCVNNANARDQDRFKTLDRRALVQILVPHLQSVIAIDTECGRVVANLKRLPI
jgi:hypothetical protein